LGRGEWGPGGQDLNAGAAAVFEDLFHVFVKSDERVGIAVTEAHGGSYQAGGKAVGESSEFDGDLGINVHGPVGESGTLDAGEDGRGERETRRIGEADDPVKRSEAESFPEEIEVGFGIAEEARQSGFSCALVTCVCA
jgi:hypothetical protein